jgi:hypothetical protein
MTQQELEQLGLETLKAKETLDALAIELETIEKKFDTAEEIYNALNSKYQIHEYHTYVNAALDNLTVAYGAFKRSILNIKPAEINNLEEFKQTYIPVIKSEFTTFVNKIDECKNLFLNNQKPEVITHENNPIT